MFQLSCIITSHAHGHFTHETKCPYSLHYDIIHLLKKVETIQVRLTLEGEGLRPKETLIDEKYTWDSYMVDYKQRLMVCRNLPHAFNRYVQSKLINTTLNNATFRVSVLSY